VLAGGLAAVVAGCSPVGLYDAISAQAARRRDDLAYGDHPRQRFDLHAPDAAAIPPAGAPLVVFFYGGSWESGRKDRYAFAGAAFARMGAVAAVADYRLHPEVAYPAFLDDCAAAVAAARAAAPELGADPDRIVLAGHSAGAYNAAMLAVDRRWLDGAGVPRAAVRGWIGLSGPYDFWPFDVRVTRAVFGDAEEPRQTQPVTHVDAGDPPAFLMHGTGDGTVRPANTRAMTEALEGAGVAVETRLLDGAGHPGSLLSVAGAFAEDEDVAAVRAFLGRVAGPLAEG
jgi:acetyl esterase/lipase